MAPDNNKLAAKESFYAPEARILVVDDTRMNLIVMNGLLKHTGMQIDTADSGMDCLLLAEKIQYHIIFLDIRMPEMDGVETLHRLLTLEGSKNKNTHVIALTANSVSETREEYAEEGFSDYLSKPVELEKLENTILKYLPVELVLKNKYEEKDKPVSEDSAEEMPDIAGLDVVMGIQACGDAATFQKILKEFYLTASERIQEIENYIQTENYNGFTIKVHSLKSSARLIGAIELSEISRDLEECGNSENIPEIKQKTPELTEHYRELAKAIGVYINENADNNVLPVIERESLMDALNTIYEFVETFDFDSADSIMEMLDEYTIPAEYCDAIQKLKVLLISVARDDIMRHIKGVEEQALPEPDEGVSIDIPNIDVESALEGLGGSLEEYINILKAFTEDEKERIVHMENCIITDNIELYTVYAHSLKSSAAIVGALELSRLAERLEMAGKKGDFEYIKENHNEFSIKTNRIIEDLICFLQQHGGLEAQEKEHGCIEFLLENLTVIDTALMDYEINVADEALARLNNMQWSNDISLALSEIAQKMRAFDYEDAQLLAGNLLKMEERKI